MFAPAIDITLRTQPALERLYAKGVFRLLIGSHVVAVREGSVDVKPLYASRAETIEAGTVVWISIRKGNDELAADLAGSGVPVVRIGDALAARNIQTAIREGHLTARALTRQPLPAASTQPDFA
jgi:hypothetical protein